jgi:CheY-like chemotaxis protein/cell division septation protein DedD
MSMQDRPILLIDNDATAVKLVTDTLQPLGYTVVTASSGDAGLSTAKEQTPSLILINLAVPGSDGLNICKIFIGTKSLKDVPLVLLTLREGNYDPRYKSQYGIVEFLRKPVNPQELTSIVGKFALPASAAEAVEEPEAAETVEILEEDVPTASELEASIASYEEGAEPLTPIEETFEAAETVEVIPEEEVLEVAEAVEVIPEEEALEAAEVAFEIAETEEVTPEVEDVEEAVSEWAIPEEEVAEVSAEEEVPEWSVPEEEAAAEAPTEEEVPEWSAPEEEAAAEAPAKVEVPEEEAAAEDTDWSSLNDEPAPAAEEAFEFPDHTEEAGMPEEETPGEEAQLDFDVGESQEKEEELYEEPGGFAEQEEEYEIRPAALERAKRRRKSSRLLITLVAVLVLCAAAAGGYFFFVSGEDKVAPTPKKPTAPIAKKAEPAPKPTKPATKPPVTAAKRPKARAPVAAKKKPAPTRAYYVQFGAFRSHDNAKKLQKQLKGSGYDVFVKESFSGDKPLYFVLLSDRFTDKWTAFKQAKQIENTAHIGTAVHME